jgi:hypothetical protein
MRQETKYISFWNLYKLPQTVQSQSYYWKYYWKISELLPTWWKYKYCWISHFVEKQTEFQAIRPHESLKAGMNYEVQNRVLNRILLHAWELTWCQNKNQCLWQFGKLKQPPSWNLYNPSWTFATLFTLCATQIKHLKFSKPKTEMK